jgi:outer membrane receptor for ferrienterochelin and colicins
MLVTMLWCTVLFGAPDSSASKQTMNRTLDSIRSKVMEQVVVTGTRNEVLLKNSPVRVEVVNANTVKGTGMATVGDLLKEQTGLLLQGTIRNGVQMNGLGADYTMILLDGQPMIGRVGGVLDLQRLSVGNIERIEIVKGPMSSMYGSEALAGVINIISKKPNPGIETSVFAQGITKGAQEVRVETSIATDTLKVTGFLNAKHSPAFFLDTGSASVPFASFTDGTAQLSALWSPSRHWKLKGWARGFTSISQGAFVESVLGQVAQNQGSVQQSDASASLVAEYFYGKAKLTTSGYGSIYAEKYMFDVEQGSAGRVDNLQRRNARLFSQYDLVVAETSRLTIGGELLFDDIMGSRYADSTDQDYRPFYRTGVGFLQWEGHPNDWIAYVLSGRFDANNVFGSALSPRFSLLLKPGEHLRISSSIGSGFKAPDFRQLFVSFSNRLPNANYDLIGAARIGSTLEAERALSYDVSLRYEDGHYALSEQLAVLYFAEVRAFRNNIDNLIEFFLFGELNNRAVYSYRNIASATTQGLECSMSIAFAHSSFGTLTFSGGYQYLDAFDNQVVEAIEAGTAGTISQPLTKAQYGGLWGRSAHSGTMRVQFTEKSGAFSANCRMQFVGRFGDEALDINGIVISNPARKVLDLPEEYVAGYTVVNFGVAYNFMPSFDMPFSLTAGFNNVLNVANPTRIPGLVGAQVFMSISVQL